MGSSPIISSKNSACRSFFFPISLMGFCRCDSMVECQLPKLNTRVRFPSSAPIRKGLMPLRCQAFFFLCFRIFSFLKNCIFYTLYIISAEIATESVKKTPFLSLFFRKRKARKRNRSWCEHNKRQRCSRKEKRKKTKKEIGRKERGKKPLVVRTQQKAKMQSERKAKENEKRNGSIKKRAIC